MLDIALVSYINTRPFLDGLGQQLQKEEARLHLMPPSECADFLAAGNCDLALLPVGAIPRFQRKLAILPNYCIGANGAVESVFILSQRPIEELSEIVLDRHSNTSNGLAQILMHYHWKRDLKFIPSADKNFHLIGGKTGGVVIGDHAIRIKDQFEYVYDLSEEWKKLTGLPFAFAVWAYDPGKIDEQQMQRLNEAFKWGVSRPKETADKWAVPFDIPLPFARHYLTNCIDFQFDAPKHRAMRLYLNLLRALDPVTKKSYITAPLLQ